MSLKQQIDSQKLPHHVAIIMDGNGRWAKRKGFLRSIGHENGVDALRKIATSSAKLGVRYLTVYAFSSENWNRPRKEVNALMSLLVSSLRKELKTLTDNEIQLNAIGCLDNLPPKCQNELNEVITKTAFYEVRKYGALLKHCYEAAEGSEAKAQCLGAMSGACMAGEEGGETTLGISRCQYGEAVLWDRYLNDEYRRTMRMMRSLDQDEAELFPEFANREETLLHAQRAWLAFRDASCEMAYAQWGAGSMRHIAGTGCAMDFAAERTIALIRMREMFQ